MKLAPKLWFFWCFLTCCKLLPSAEKNHKILGPKVWWKSQPSARYFGLVNRNTILRPLLQEEGGHKKLSYMSQTGHGLLFFDGLNFKGQVSPVISKGRCQGETMTMLDIAANCNPTRFLCFLFRDSLFPDGTLHWTWISHVVGGLYSMSAYGSVWVLPSHLLRNCVKSSLVLVIRCNQTLWLPNPLVCRVSLLLQHNRWEHHRRGVFSEPREVPPCRFFPHFFSARMWKGTKGRSTCQTWISVDRVMSS